MSTQSYYKDRLGFDPREALYDGAPASTTLKSARGSSVGRTINDTFNGSGSSNHYDHHTSPAKKQKQQHNNSNASNGNQGGYEDALTQFKGTMSVWNYFVENWDITGMSKMCASVFGVRFCPTVCFG